MTQQPKLPSHSLGIRFVNGRPLPDPHYHYDDATGRGSYAPGHEPVCCGKHRRRWRERERYRGAT